MKILFFTLTANYESSKGSFGISAQATPNEALPAPTTAAIAFAAATAVPATNICIHSCSTQVAASLDL